MIKGIGILIALVVIVIIVVSLIIRGWKRLTNRR